MTTSPGRILALSMIFFLSTMPTRETRQIIVIHRHHAGMFGGLAADQSANSAWTQPSATPPTISAMRSGTFLPQAM